MARILLLILLLLPFARPALPETPADVRLQYIERDLDRLRQEIGTRPEMARVQQLEAEIAGLRAALKEAEKAATDGVKEKLDAQDKRIGDLSVTLTMQANQLSGNSLSVSWMSIFITVALFFVTGWTAISVPRQATDAAKIKAEELTKGAISEARTQAESTTETWIAEKALPRLIELEKLAEAQRDANKRIMEATISEMDARTNQSLRSDGKVQVPKSPQDPRTLAEERNAVDYILSLPPSERSASQWRALIQSLVEQKSYEAALAQADLWISYSGKVSGDTALALRTKANVLLKAGYFADAIKLNDDLLVRYRHSQDPSLREHVASALVSKGVALTMLSPPKFHEALDVFREVDVSFYGDPNPELRKQVAWALFYKVLTLEDINKIGEARAVAEDYLGISTFTDAQEPEIQNITTAIRAWLAQTPQP